MSAHKDWRGEDRERLEQMNATEPLNAWILVMGNHVRREHKLLYEHHAVTMGWTHLECAEST